MQVIRSADLRPQRMATGGGSTRVLAALPAGSVGSGELQWQVTIAEVAKAGPVPASPGMDRILTVIAGDLVLLTVDGADHPLEKYRPYRFPGEPDAAVSLPTGSILALNVLTRRGAFRSFATIVELSKKRPHPVFAGQLALLLEGSAIVQDSGAASAPATALGACDAVVGSDEAPEISGRGFLAVVTIEAL